MWTGWSGPGVLSTPSGPGMVAERPEAPGRVPAAFLLPSSARSPAFLSPLWLPCTPAYPTGCHAPPLCTGSPLGTASHPALHTVPPALAPLLAETTPQCKSLSSLGTRPELLKVLTRGPREHKICTQGWARHQRNHYLLTLVSSALLLLSLGGLWGGTSTASVRPRAQGSPPMVAALPWHTTVCTPPSALHRCTHTHTHTHTHAHTHAVPLCTRNLQRTLATGRQGSALRAPWGT